MKQVLSAALSVLVVVGVVGVSTAGMMDSLKGKAEETQEISSEAHKGMDMTGDKKEQAIEAQGATKEEASGMMDQAKETAKDQAKEKIDTLGE